MTDERDRGKREGSKQMSRSMRDGNKRKIQRAETGRVETLGTKLEI